MQPAEPTKRKLTPEEEALLAQQQGGQPITTARTLLDEYIDPGSTAPPPPADTSMYSAPVAAQYQPGGAEYTPAYDDYVAQQYGASVPAAQPLAAINAPAPTALQQCAVGNVSERPAPATGQHP